MFVQRRRRSVPGRSRSRRAIPTRACAPARACWSRQAGDRLEQLARARTRRSAARTPACEPAVRRAVPARADRDALVDRVPRLLLQPPRHLRVEVHHALADRRAQAAVRDGLEHHIGVVHRLHRQHRRSCRWHSSSVVASRVGGAQRRRRVRGFHRPDARPQPVHQRQIVGVTAKQRLAQMDVRLDEAGQHVAAARVDDAIVRLGDVRPDRRRCGRRGSTRRRRRCPRRSFIVRTIAAADEERHTWRSTSSAQLSRRLTADLSLESLQSAVEPSASTAEWALPCLTAMSSARMLTAISCGVTAPMSRPIGAWTRVSSSAGICVGR